MDRYKWLNIQWSHTINSLSASLEHNSYDDDSDAGFSVIRRRGDHIETKFIEKKIFDTDFLDEQGTVIKTKRVLIEDFFVDFYNQSIRANLIIKNYPRSLATFKNKLAEIGNYDIAINEIKNEPLEWLEFIETKLELRTTVISIQIGNILFKNGLTGKLVLKGNKDIRDRMLSEIHSDSFTIEKIHFKLAGLFNGEAILSNDSSIKLKIDRSEDFISIISDFF